MFTFINVYVCVMRYSKWWSRITAVSLVEQKRLFLRFENFNSDFPFILSLMRYYGVVCVFVS